ncbi:MAG: NYN domain-containing protein [Clostridiales bacterium]|nr:NYN domain-containing protein [Clostridiales bacterium]
MLRGMVFVDHMNFDIAIRDYYIKSGRAPISLDYGTLFQGIVSLLPNIDYLKTFIFAPAPDKFLMQDEKLSSYYRWIQGLKGSPCIDIIEGRYLARPKNPTVEMDINDTNTYYKVEKGTDINLAIHAITKAQANSFDVAFIVSADTDYIPIYRQLKTLGKITVVVAVDGQKISKIRPECDNCIFLDDKFFTKHIRRKKEEVDD